MRPISRNGQRSATPNAQKVNKLAMTHFKLPRELNGVNNTATAAGTTKKSDLSSIETGVHHQAVPPRQAFADPESIKRRKNIISLTVGASLNNRARQRGSTERTHSTPGSQRR